MRNSETHLRSIVDHDGAVVLDIEHDLFFSLNPVGAYVWKKLEAGNEIHEIKYSLALETGADFEVVSSDVDEFIEDLKSKNLIHFTCGSDDGFERKGRR